MRCLAESEMHDAVHPDEFRQRFAAAAAVRHVHVAATYEVLEIAGRPAVLQEWLTGLPGSDWPALSSAPGVWFRLLSQAALGLRTAHDAGMVHGALQAASFVCTPEGVIKLCGLGEPCWLAVAPADAETDAAADLRALGRIAAGWSASATAAPRKGKNKAMPEALEGVLARLTGQAEPPTPARPSCSKTSIASAPRRRPTRRPGSASSARCASRRRRRPGAAPLRK